MILVSLFKKFVILIFVIMAQPYLSLKALIEFHCFVRQKSNKSHWLAPLWDHKWYLELNANDTDKVLADAMF